MSANEQIQLWSMGSSDNQYPLIILIIGSISILFSLIIIITYFVNANAQNFSTKMIVSLCFSDILFTLGIISNSRFINLQNIFICNFTAILASFGSLSSLSWGCIIAYSVYINVQKPGDKQILKKTKKMVKKQSLLYAYAIPFIISVIPLLFQDYQNIGETCFITLKSKSGYVQNIIFSLIPLFFEICFMFFYIIKALNSQNKDFQKNGGKQLLIYPLICVVAFGSFFSQKLYEVIYKVSCGCDYTWHSISFILCAFNGTLNAIFYGFNSSIGFQIRQFFIKVCRRMCCFNYKDNNTTENNQIQKKFMKEQSQTENQYTTEAQSKNSMYQNFIV